MSTLTMTYLFATAAAEAGRVTGTVLAPLVHAIILCAPAVIPAEIAVTFGEYVSTSVASRVSPAESTTVVAAL